MSQLRLANAAGAIASDVSELTRFFVEVMQGKVVSEKSTQELISGCGYQNRGMGVNSLEVSGQTLYCHGGLINGYLSVVYLLPEKAATLTVFTNTESEMDQLLEHLLVRFIEMTD